MLSRLVPIDMSEVMKLTDETGKLMVIDAYSQPLYATKKMKRRAVSEFKSKHYMACYKAKGL